MSDTGVEVLIGVTAEYAGLLHTALRTIPREIGVVVVRPAHQELPPMSRDYIDVPTSIPFSRGGFLNVAAQAATAPIIVLADADFIFLPGHFEMLSHYLMYCSLEDRYVNTYVYTLAEAEKVDVQSDLSRLAPYSIGAGSILPTQNPCMLTRKNFVDNLGGYDPGFHGWGGEDDDLDRRMNRLGLIRVRLPMLVLHQHHGKISQQPEYYDQQRHAQNVAIIHRNDAHGRIKV